MGMGLAISEMNSNTDLIPAVTRGGYEYDDDESWIVNSPELNDKEVRLC